MILPEDHVRINVRYLIPRKELKLFIDTIEPFMERVDKEEGNSKTKRKLIIISVMSSEKWETGTKLYNLARRKGYGANGGAGHKKTFKRDMVELMAQGFIYGQIKKNEWHYIREDEAKIEMSIR